MQSSKLTTPRDQIAEVSFAFDHDRIVDKEDVLPESEALRGTNREFRFQSKSEREGEISIEKCC